MTLSKSSIGLLLALLGATPLAGQRRAASPFGTPPRGGALALPPMTGGAQSVEDDEVGLMVLGGVVLGGLGWYGGANAAFPYWIHGALVGSAVGISLEVHLAGPRRRSIAPSLAASWAIAGAGIVALRATDNDVVLSAVLLGAPVAQLIAAVSIESAAGCECPRRQ